MRLLGLLVAIAAVLPVTGAAAAPVRTQVASCEEGPIQYGHGVAGWRQRSEVAGPLGLPSGFLQRMVPTASGQLVMKAPATVEGSAVILRVPPRLRHRVSLYYGRRTDREGRPTNRVGQGPGFSEVAFHPCGGRPRTVFPGGVRVRGRAPVRLLVQVEGGSASIPMPLGRPRALEPRRAS